MRDVLSKYCFVARVGAHGANACCKSNSQQSNSLFMAASKMKLIVARIVAIRSINGNAKRRRGISCL